ncbi:hypothetical protein B0T22DRAFT_148908 [Podospora appendiculata]|uniref:Uncharacterized protein n=1 Tax=Podospora appendiculata TaxID=314037 RepID=A0AAE0X9P4_9PEZI|nr:hypothetical protein B0T22DRAFT_148908 [Podospora appendiculata]
MSYLWRILIVQSSAKLWFSDGQPVDDPRSGAGTSSRLIADGQGFLDLTGVPSAAEPILDANGLFLWISPTPAGASAPKHVEPETAPLPFLDLFLQIADNNSFTLTCIAFGNATVDDVSPSSVPTVSGQLMPLPVVSPADADFITSLIEQKYIPYQDIPDAPGKTIAEITALGQQLFPFSPYSFQLAMCIYDWTTASFTRLVFLKIFEYTGVPPSPFPLDQGSIATQIWESNWGTYLPQNPDYMNSFMMQPAASLGDVSKQLGTVAGALQNLSEVENRILSAAAQSLPRTSMFQFTQLFSGQVDIYQLGLDHFGIEFLECPLNDNTQDVLEVAFSAATASYASPGHVVTTKMVWSFTSSATDAIHYSNGILLVANIPSNSVVWDRASYVTTLSDDPNKDEYLFMPSTQFIVESISNAVVKDTSVTVITLQPLDTQAQALARSEPTAINGILSKLPRAAKLDESQILDLVRAGAPGSKVPHTAGKTNGRRCACIEEDAAGATMEN